MEIPVTRLREFYKFLGIFSTETHLKILEDFNRKNNYTKLIKIFEESQVHFAKYSSNDSFTSASKRKALPSLPIHTIKRTNDFVAILESNKTNKINKNPDFDFVFIDREISPFRTTGGIKFETGKSGKSSGTGGLDFIGKNIKNGLPIIGEIKVGNDKNPFFAVIQLLTYLSELTTNNQLERIRSTNLFKNRTTKVKSDIFYLYILLSNYNLNSPLKKKLLNESQKLAQKLKEIGNIKDIVFIELNDIMEGMNQVHK
tara:strand:- start:762112 stop:762882 length:771 start_codon:yes stop_codon:yes gene_type:complete